MQEYRLPITQDGQRVYDVISSIDKANDTGSLNFTGDIDYKKRFIRFAIPTVKKVRNSRSMNIWLPSLRQDSRVS